MDKDKVTGWMYWITENFFIGVIILLVLWFSGIYTDREITIILTYALLFSSFYERKKTNNILTRKDHNNKQGASPERKAAMSIKKMLSDEEMQFCKRAGITPGKYLEARAMVLDCEAMSPYNFLNEEERNALKIAGGSEKDAAAYLLARRDAENARIKKQKEEAL